MVCFKKGTILNISCLKIPTIWTFVLHASFISFRQSRSCPRGQGDDVSGLKIMGVLALAALLAVPAMSMHDGMRGRFDDRGCGPEVGPGGVWLLMDDLTQEELDNMTLAEIRELREKKRAELENMTLAEIRELKEKKIAEMNNTTLAEMRGKYMECPYWPMGGAQGPRGPERQV